MFPFPTKYLAQAGDDESGGGFFDFLNVDFKQIISGSAPVGTYLGIIAVIILGILILRLLTSGDARQDLISGEDGAADIAGDSAQQLSTGLFLSALPWIILVAGIAAIFLFTPVGEIATDLYQKFRSEPPVPP